MQQLDHFFDLFLCRKAKQQHGAGLVVAFPSVPKAGREALGIGILPIGYIRAAQLIGHIRRGVEFISRFQRLHGLRVPFRAAEGSSQAYCRVKITRLYLYNRLIQQYGLLVVSGVVVLQRVCKELLHRGLRCARLRLLYRRNTSAHQQRHNDRRNQYPPHRYYPLIALFRCGVGVCYLSSPPRHDAPLRV